MDRRLSVPLSLQTLSRQLLAPVLQFLHVEAASGILLLMATLAGLIWANWPGSESYVHLWHHALPGVGEHDVLFLVNEGLMTGFFLLVGLEIRRELHEGALADVRVATLPLLAALGGVTAPALLYLLIASTEARGWAVPTATDIAFAVGVLSLLGKGLPPMLRVLLLTLAIADDIAAILIIAFFYSGHIALTGLAIAATGMGLLWLLQRIGAGVGIGLLMGVVIWYGMLVAGVHPTLAGVILGLMTPVTASSHTWLTGLWERLGWKTGASSEPPCHRLEHRLHPWVSYGILPLFALANAGVSLQGLSWTGLPLQVAGGIVAGLVLGKPLGIILASLLATRLGVTKLPPGVQVPHLVLLGNLGGIGFTMAMFLCNLAFNDAALLRTAKVAVLVASAVSAALALLGGWWVPRQRAV